MLVGKEFELSAACIASVSVRFRIKERWMRVKDRAKNGKNCISFHFSLGQNRESRYSVFLRSETKRKRLLRRLSYPNFELIAKMTKSQVKSRGNGTQFELAEFSKGFRVIRVSYCTLRAVVSPGQSLRHEEKFLSPRSVASGLKKLLLAGQSYKDSTVCIYLFSIVLLQTFGFGLHQPKSISLDNLGSYFHLYKAHLWLATLW